MPRRADVLRGSGGLLSAGFHPPRFGRWWPWPLRRCRRLWHCGYAVCSPPASCQPPPEPCQAPWGCPAQPSSVWCFPGSCRGRAGVSALLSRMPCWGCADTSGASPGTTLLLRALPKIPAEPLGIPGHGLALLRGSSSAITPGHREWPRPS